MYSPYYFLGQHEELLVVSQVAVFVVSHPAVVPGGQQDSFTAAGAGWKNTLNPMMPAAARMTTAKIIFDSMLFFFGGQQFPSHPQSPGLF
jgi:hypothetical protein